MKKIIRYAVALGFVFAGMATTAMAASDTNKTLAVVGTQTGQGYFRLVEPTSVNCVYGNFYIPNLGNDAAQRALYATVLAAQATGGKITRVDYSVDANGMCTVGLVETAPN